MKRAILFLALLLAHAMTRSAQAQDGGFCTNSEEFEEGLSISSVKTYGPNDFAQDISYRLPFCGTGWSVYYRSDAHKPSTAALDFNKDGGDEGQAVVASAGGTIAGLGYDCVNNPYGNSYGVNVVIDHGNGYKTRYAHLQCGSSAGLSVGQKVKRADRIGKVGNTGAASGAHLHWETTYNGTYFYAYFDETGLLNGSSSSGRYLHTTKDRMTASPCDGTDPGGNPPGTPPSQPKITRAFALGQGTANPEAWVEGYTKAGGFNELGIPTTSPAWNNGFVTQILTRPDTMVQSALVHDETRNSPYAWAIVDAFYAQWLAYGGMAVVGAPIGNKYNFGGGVDRQDFTNGSMTHDSSGFHFQKNYQFGYRPGQGSSNPAAFQFGYTQAGGNAFGNPTGTVFVDNGYEVQIFQDPQGKAARLVLNPGYIQAFGVKGYMYTSWMASGHVYGGWGIPTSIEYFIGPNQTMQRFRFGVAYKNDKNVVTFAPNPSSDARRYAPGEGMPPERAAHIITAYERNGGAGKLGICTAPYDINGYSYQYCSGGAYSGRATIVLNYAFGGYVAIVVRGSIQAYWESTGGISGPMGTPYTEEFASVMFPGSKGQEFGHTIERWYEYTSHLVPYPYGYTVGDGATHWSAFAIMRRYNTDIAGYAKTRIYWSGQGQVQDFQGGLYSGKVSYVHDATSRAARAYLVKGGIGNMWWSLGGGTSYLGLPVSDEIVSGNKVTQYFQFGVISGDITTAVYQNRKY